MPAFLEHWMGHKFRSKVNRLLRKYYGYAKGQTAKTWLYRGTRQGKVVMSELVKATPIKRGRFTQRIQGHPYLQPTLGDRMATQVESGMR